MIHLRINVHRVPSTEFRLTWNRKWKNPSLFIVFSVESPRNWVSNWITKRPDPFRRETFIPALKWRVKAIASGLVHLLPVLRPSKDTTKSDAHKSRVIFFLRPRCRVNCIRKRRCFPRDRSPRLYYRVELRFTTRRAVILFFSLFFCALPVPFGVIIPRWFVFKKFPGERTRRMGWIFKRFEAVGLWNV